MHWTLGKYTGLGATSVLAATLLAGPALADGMPSYGRMSSEAPSSRPCSVSGSVGVTSDYVFRGISQSDESAAIQGGVDLTCGRFYVGVAGSSIDFDGDFDASTELDVYAGYKFGTGPISWDVGVLYYGYPGAEEFTGAELDYVELKLAASASLWRGGTLGGTVFYSPEYTGELGPATTLEGSLSQELPKVGMFSPTFSATIGTTLFDDDDSLDYTYWNAGVSVGFLEKWSLDLRYWDSDGEGFADVGPLSDERFVGTVKYSF